MVSVVPNGIKYLQYLSQLLNNSEIIQEPKIVNNLVIIHKNKKKNKVLGWVILDKEVKFRKGGYLDCDEIAESSGNYGKFIINRFSYHFSATGDLLEFRIDLQEGDLHAHPDDRTKLSSHLRPEKELCERSIVLDKKRPIILDDFFQLINITYQQRVTNLTLKQPTNFDPARTPSFFAPQAFA